jgi:hypothetical protein
MQPLSGHDTSALQAWLGHKNIQHTVRYTELAAPQGIESGHDAADVGCGGGARQKERDDRADYLAGHCFLLFMPAKPILATRGYCQA